MNKHREGTIVEYATLTIITTASSIKKYRIGSEVRNRGFGKIVPVVILSAGNIK